MSKLSAEAFLHQIESGKRTTDAMRVYELISNYELISRDTHGNCGISFKDIKRKLFLTHPTASARLSELCDLGVIYEDNNGYFHITPSDKVGEYAARREDARYRKWKKLGEKNGWFGQLRLEEINGRKMLLT